MGFVRNLVSAFVTDGISLMALLGCSARMYANRCALVCDDTRLSYSELYGKARLLAALLYKGYKIEKGSRIAMFCRNHEWSSLVLLASSRLGADVMLINTDVGSEQLKKILSKGTTDVLFYDEEYEDKVCGVVRNATLVSMATVTACAEERACPVRLPYVVRGGRITVYTGGSSGNYKAVTRRSGFMQFLPPLHALIRNIHVNRYESVLVMLPFYHGFGLATFAVSLFLGKKICLMRHFDAERAVQIVGDEAIEALPVVPAMLSRMMKVAGADNCMKSIKCIICGGDVLENVLLRKVQKSIGDVLFNLYGTTETGFFMLASPEDLEHSSEVTLGKPIAGVRCCMRDIDDGGIGTLCVKPQFVGNWLNTGDRIWRDANGLYYYRGRADNMVVCGGENVYPENLQRVLNMHPDIVDSLVYAVDDVSFGKVLCVKVELRNGASLTTEDIRNWLRSRVSRAEMPHEILFASVSLLSTGKRLR